MKNRERETLEQGFDVLFLDYEINESGRRYSHNLRGTRCMFKHPHRRIEDDRDSIHERISVAMTSEDAEFAVTNPGMRFESEPPLTTWTTQQR